MNVVDSKSLERDAGEKPVPTFSHPGLGKAPTASSELLPGRRAEANACETLSGAEAVVWNGLREQERLSIVQRLRNGVGCSFERRSILDEPLAGLPVERRSQKFGLAHQSLIAIDEAR